MKTRAPAVAGRFYPGSRHSLTAELARYLEPRPARRKVKGLVAPHAGYMYSGQVAGAVYAAVEMPARLVILCPNPTGVGAALAVMAGGAWQTPLGEAAVDEALAGALLKALPQLQQDESAHRYEHSLEVQLPFIQACRADFRFVPICVRTSRLETLLRLGDALGEAAAESDEPVLLVASSDMTHYEPAAEARRKDHLAIRYMEALDPEGLAQVVDEESISMCGWAPAVAVIQACRRLGAQKGELVRYATSGDVTGDQGSVVGYAGLVFY